MKNVLIFIGGMVTGAAILIGIAFFFNKMAEQETLGETNDKAAFYEGFVNGEIIKEESFQVLQVLEDNAALVQGKDEIGGSFYMGKVYLLIGQEGTTFYDEQIVDVPQGSVVRMNGTYKYPTRDGFDKTVPRIMIMDK